VEIKTNVGKDKYFVPVTLGVVFEQRAVIVCVMQNGAESANVQ
jgi:hypothetical protein